MSASAVPRVGRGISQLQFLVYADGEFSPSRLPLFGCTRGRERVPHSGLNDMLFAPFQKSWWKSLMKPEDDGNNDGSGAGLTGHDNAALTGEQSLPAASAWETESAELPRPAPAPSTVEEEATAPGRTDEPPADRSRAAAAPSTDPVDEPEEGIEDDDGFTHEGSELEYETDDPLAPAYDLERGVPLSHNKHHDQEFRGRNKVRSPKEFFNSEILYRFDILADEDRQNLRGRYRIELKGYQGGVWTILVGEQMDIVNRREDAEIVFTMQQSDFLHLVNGQLNPQLALFAQKMRVQGDVRRAVLFQDVLVPGNDG